MIKNIPSLTFAFVTAAAYTAAWELGANTFYDLSLMDVATTITEDAVNMYKILTLVFIGSTSAFAGYLGFRGMKATFS